MVEWAQAHGQVIACIRSTACEPFSHFAIQPFNYTTLVLKTLLQRLLVVAYLFLTAAAFVFTLFHVTFVPYAWIHWSYGMMAPYQGDTDVNADLMAEGEASPGHWQAINLDSYMPYGFGERNARKFLRVYEPLGEQTEREKYTELTLEILDRERAGGRAYHALRLTIDTWPRSPDGFEALHHAPYTQKEFVTLAL